MSVGRCEVSKIGGEIGVEGEAWHEEQAGNGSPAS